jgi:hypothetical protein
MDSDTEEEVEEGKAVVMGTIREDLEEVREVAVEMQV